MPGCVRQSYGKVPFVLKVRETTAFCVTGMLAGAPATLWNVTSCATPVMLNRTVPPTEIVTNAGLNARPGVKTSTVVAGGSPPPGAVGESPPPPQPEAIAMTTMPAITRRRMTSSLALHRVTLAAVTALTLAACSGGDKVTGPSETPAPATPTGAYTLTTVDAKGLPWTMYAVTGYTLEIQSATLSVTADGKWVSKSVTRETVDSFVSTYTDSTFGTWTATAGTASSATTKSAVFTNAETSQTSSITWTAAGLTVQQLDGATTHAYAYKRN